MRPSPCLLPALLALVLAACSPEPAPAVAPPATGAAKDAESMAADPQLAGTDASAVVRHEPRDPEGFDRKAFAGRFSGILPCADCPGIETTLEIRADGTYALAETRSGDEAIRVTGTWTLDADAAGLLLDPDSKDAPDRRFELVSRDEIRALDVPAGQAGANTSLRRS